MNYRIVNGGIKLIASYSVSKKKYSYELKKIRNLHPDLPLWNRSDASLRREWAAHNLAYAIGFKRDRTADCDLNIGQRWYVKLVYYIVGTFALLFVK